MRPQLLLTCTAWRYALPAALPPRPNSLGRRCQFVGPSAPAPAQGAAPSLQGGLWQGNQVMRPQSACKRQQMSEHSHAASFPWLLLLLDPQYTTSPPSTHHAPSKGHWTPLACGLRTSACVMHCCGSGTPRRSRCCTPHHHRRTSLPCSCAACALLQVV